MASFQQNDITYAGLVLMSKGAAGAHIEYTKIVMGQGYIPDGTQPRDVTDVFEPFAELEIRKLKVLEGEQVGLVAIGGDFTNEVLTEDKFYRELGLYAIDPDRGEILYAYGNAGMNAELIPAPGGQTAIEKKIDVITSIGSAENVSVRIPTELYATKEEFDEYVTQTDSAIQNKANVDDMDTALATKANVEDLVVLINDGEQRIPNTWYCLNPAATSDERVYTPWYECGVYIPSLPPTSSSPTYLFSDYSTMSNSENVEYVRGYYQNSSGQKNPIAFAGASSANMTTLQNITNTSFQIYVGSNRSAYSGVFYFRYTKSTDTAKTKADILVH